MKRAILVTVGTVAGVTAALSYSPAVPSMTDVAAAEGLGGLGGLGAAPAATAPETPAAPGAPTASAPPASRPAAKPGAAPKPATTKKPGTVAPAGVTPVPTTPAPSTPAPSTPAPTTPKPSATPKPPKASPKPTTTKKPTPTPTPTKPAKPSGDFTGAAARAGIYGRVQVQIRVKDGVITDIGVPAYPQTDPKSVTLSAQAIPTLRSEALAAQSAAIATVSGASFTSEAFKISLQAAITAAGLVSAPTLDAQLDGWVREVHQEQVWGTVVTFDVRDESLDRGARAAIDGAVAFLHQVDAWFSTYRMDTPITALRMGLVPLHQMPQVVREVLDQCAWVRDLTGGVFDPWAVPGGVDPSGYVKGWAADVAADMIVAAGYGNVSVNAAGDVTCRGEQSADQPWVIGIRHPDEIHTIVATTEVYDGAIATSGEYERGSHVLDPRTGRHEVALRSATVVGPDGGVADALATALLIAGTPGVRWFAGMPDWSGYLIEGGTAHFFGPAFDRRSIPSSPPDSPTTEVMP